MTTSLRGLKPADAPQIEKMLARIKEFHPDDQTLAMELIRIAMDQPDQRDYEFLVAVDEQNRTIGYACFGPTPITDGTFDLYWIAVDPDYAGQGVGTRLLQAVEQNLVERNARLVVIETSSDPIYDLTRKFYVKNGYQLAESIKDFFRDGEDRVTYTRRLR